VGDRDETIRRLREDVQQLTEEQDFSRGLVTNHQAAIDAGLAREEVLKGEIQCLKAAYDALASQRLAELEQLNSALFMAAHKIEELTVERDLLLKDKALLTAAVQDSYRTHCSEVRHTFLDNLKPTRSVGTQLDCCVCAMRASGREPTLPDAPPHVPPGAAQAGWPTINNDAPLSGSGSGGGGKHPRSSARGSFRVGAGVARTGGEQRQLGVAPPVRIVVDRTGQRYPFGAANAAALPIQGQAPRMDPSTLAVTLPPHGHHTGRSAVGGAIARGGLVALSRPVPPAHLGSMGAQPRAWVPPLPTDVASKRHLAPDAFEWGRGRSGSVRDTSRRARRAVSRWGRKPWRRRRRGPMPCSSTSGSAGWRAIGPQAKRLPRLPGAATAKRAAAPKKAAAWGRGVAAGGTSRRRDWRWRRGGGWRIPPRRARP